MPQPVSPLVGTVYSVIGAGAGALVSFFIARALGREVITRLLKSGIEFCQRCSERNLFYVILFSRLLPAFSFDLVSYGSGISLILGGFLVLFSLLAPRLLRRHNPWGLYDRLEIHPNLRRERN